MHGKGDKLHALVGSDGSLAGWRVAPMHKDEWVMAGRLLQAAPPEVLGSVAAAANFDSNRRHRIGDDRGDRQLVTPRRYGPGRETGNRKQTAGRLRSIALTESPLPTFAEQLLKEEKAAAEERERQLTELRREALAARDAERRKAEADAAAVIEAAKSEAHKALEGVRTEIENELRAGERELEQLSRTLAVELAGRVLGRPVSGAVSGS